MPSIGDVGIGAGGKPKRITILTTGTGTYVPLSDNAPCRARLAGGGASGSGNGPAGGGAGAFVEGFLLVPIAGISYTVGAGGPGVGTGVTTGNDGSVTRFGPLSAEGGKAGYYFSGSNANAGRGGLPSNHSTSYPGTTVQSPNGSSTSGVAGGAGGYGSNTPGKAPGFPEPALYSNGTSQGGATGPQVAAQQTCTGGQAGGGDSFLGKGTPGVTGTSAAAVDGGGSGSGTTGSGPGGNGRIEVWEW